MTDKYKILPVKKKHSVNPKWSKVDKRLPIHPFCVLVSAGPKSGKTNWLINQLLNPAFDWINKFDKIVWISPTVMSDKTARPIVDIVCDEDHELNDKIKLFTGDDIDHIDEIINEVVKMQIEEPETDTLIILDDCIGKLKNGQFGKLCAKYRHNNISLCGISQMFKSFDVISRASANGYILFRTFNDAERKKILNELGNFPEIDKHFHTATKEKHNFLWCNVEEQELWHNFETKLWCVDSDEKPCVK